MTKHNNVIPNAHFHKDWQRKVRTWFDQPAKKIQRRGARVAKAKRITPRPLDLLRPMVRGQTNKYNARIRAGRGFTLEELKAAGVRRKEALGVGIPVDHRRKNRSEEAFQSNVARLKLYKSKLIVFPRNPTSKRAKKGDATKEETKKANQVSITKEFPVMLALPRIKARKITKDELAFEAVKTLHKQRMDAKLWGAREKRAKDKASGKTGKKEKKADAEEMGDE
jgi:large subunit ribosomal protein L13e